MESRFPEILAFLHEKASLKQGIYRATLEVFTRMKELAYALSTRLQEEMAKKDSSITVEYVEENEFEFHLRFAGDLLMFTMHSNIITFPEEHILSNNAYVQEDYRRGYFGHIMVYNFMADSIRYNRLEDEGYLLGRVLLNHEQHFYIEGVRQLNFLFPDLSQNVVQDTLLQAFIENAMLIAIDTDLTAPAFQDIQVVQLGYKLQNQMVSGGAKVGFRNAAEG